MLYRVVQGAWAGVRAGLALRERPLPRFCAREVEAFLRCGIPAHGFARVWCAGCGKDDVVAFSCKGRGFCPSCGARRMADTAAWLVDRVMPGEAPGQLTERRTPRRVGVRATARSRHGTRSTRARSSPARSATSCLPTRRTAARTSFETSRANSRRP